MSVYFRGGLESVFLFSCDVCRLHTRKATTWASFSESTRLILQPKKVRTYLVSASVLLAPKFFLDTIRLITFGPVYGMRVLPGSGESNKGKNFGSLLRAACLQKVPSLWQEKHVLITRI